MEDTIPAGYQVMIVDDDAHIRIAVMETLKDEHIPVIAAESGYECIHHLKAGFRGVILLDLMMPKLDGWDTITEIIKNDLFHDIIILMLTARLVPDQKMISVQEYVFDYLVKPFEQEHLAEKVRFALDFLEP
ncbi:MAG: response regulator [Methanospirillaceae archaeon]|nr:response regulator [Methanospirillaceae archaeon]